MILEPVLEHPRRRGAAALLASLKSLQQPRPGASGEKETPLQALPHPWHPCCPDLTSLPCRPKERTGQRAMVNHAFVTDHPEPHPACCPLRCNLAGRVLPLTCYDATAWTRYCGRHHAGDGLASRMARGAPACRSTQHHGGAPGAARTSASTAQTQPTFQRLRWCARSSNRPQRT